MCATFASKAPCRFWRNPSAEESNKLDAKLKIIENPMKSNEIE